MQKPVFGRDVVYSFLATLSQGGARFVINWVVGRFGGVLALGNVMSGFSLAQLLAILGPSPAGTAASKFGASERAVVDGEYSGSSAHAVKRTAQVVPVLMVMALVVSQVVYGVAALEAAAVAVSLMGLSVWALGRGALYGQGKIRLASLIDISTAMVSVLGTLAAIQFGVDGMFLLLPAAIAQLAYVPYLVSNVNWLRPRVSVAREVDSFIFFGVAGILASAGFLHFTVVLVRAWVGAPASGQFNAAIAVSMPLLMVTSSFATVFYPRLSRLWALGDTASYRALTDKYVRIVAGVCYLLIGSLFVYSREFILFVWGDEYDQAASVVPITLLAALLKGLTAVVVSSLTAGPSWGMRASARMSVLGSSVGIIASLILIFYHGLVGAAIGFLIGTVVTSLFPLYVVWRHGRYRWGALVVRYGVGISALGGLYLLNPAIGPLWLAFFFVAISVCLLAPDLRKFASR